MEEPYVEGVAIHDGPESCVAAREGGGEALTGDPLARVQFGPSLFFLLREQQLACGVRAAARVPDASAIVRGSGTADSSGFAPQLETTRRKTCLLD